MIGIGTFVGRLLSLFRRRRLDEDLDSEIAFHVDELTKKYIERGMDPATARAEAMREFGGIDQTVEAYRDQRGLPILSQIVQDLRYGARMLMRSPAATIVAILALAIGIGVNTTMFTSVNSILLKPFPFKDLESLVRLYDTDLRNGYSVNMVSHADFTDWKEQSKAVESMSAYSSWDANLTGIDDPERLWGYSVTPDYFHMLGMPPLLGREFTKNDDAAARDREVVISHGLWQRRFAGDRGIIGRNISINGMKHAVVGVMPYDFNFPLGADIWRPLNATPAEKASRSARSLFVLGRLKHAVSIEQANAEIRIIAGRLAAQFPDTNRGHEAGAQRLRDMMNTITDRFIVILMGAAAFILLLACSNVASIQLARMNSRIREFAMRSALGAGRWRIVRQLITENILLALIGGILGFSFAYWGNSVWKVVIPARVYQLVAGLRDMRIDGTVVAFSTAVSLLAGLLCGLAPAFQVARHRDLSECLKEGGRGLSEAGGRSMRKALVVIEVAMALVMLISAGSMVKAFQHIMKFDLGFDTKNLITMQVGLPPERYADTVSVRTYYDQAISNLQRTQGVVAAGASGNSVSMTEFRVEGQDPPLPGEQLPGLKLISGDFFTAMDIYLKRGRLLSSRDEGASPAPVAIVSESVVRRWWKSSEDPIGATIHVGPYNLPPFTVVGVVDDVKDWFFGMGAPAIYISNAHMPQLAMEIVARTGADPERIIGLARTQVQAVDRNQPIYDVKSMEQNLDEQTSGVRMAAATMSIYGVIALVLAAIGTYGIVFYSVTQRKQEFGIRMAVGARPGDVVALVVGQSFQLTLLGLVIGALVAYGVGRLMANLLYGVVSPDIITFLGSFLFLAAAALIACYIPARSAARLDPNAALHSE
jgi:predicted permease